MDDSNKEEARKGIKRPYGESNPGFQDESLAS